MNNCRITLILLLIFGLGFQTFAQDQNTVDSRKWKSYVGAGYYNWDWDFDRSHILSLEYGVKLNKRNEIAFIAYYSKSGQTNYISFSTSFHWSMIKNEKRRFNFFLAPELQFRHQWNHSNSNINNYSNYNSIFFLGFIPQYRISNRFDLAMELKIGYGYRWNKFDGYFQDGVYFQSYGDWWFFISPALRLKYNLGKRN